MSGAQWKLESTDSMSADGATVKVNQKATQSTKFNAMWIDPSRAGKAVPDTAEHWEFTMGEGPEPGCFWVGYGAESNFGAGWKCKGLLFGGNTSDGGALVQGRFGPHPKTGDKVVMSVSGGEKGSLKVAFAINGAALGDAFDLEPPHTEGAWHPIASFSTGPASMTIAKVDSAPVAGASATPTDIYGDWGCPFTSVVGEAEAAQLGEAFVLTISKGDDENCRVSCKAGNNLNTGVQKIDGKWKGTGGVAGTMMMTHGPEAVLEQKMKQVLSTITDIRLADDSLCLSHESGDNILFKFRPIGTGNKPATRSQIRWL